MTKKIASFLSKTLLSTFFFSLIFLALSSIHILRTVGKLDGKIYPHVYIDGVAFGKQPIQNVEAYFREKNKELERLFITVLYEEISPTTFTARSIDLKYDIPTITSHATSIGRSPTKFTNVYQKFVTILNLGRFNLDSTISYNSKAIEDYINYIAATYNREPEDALFKVEVNRVTAFKIQKNGIEVNAEGAKEELNIALSRLNTADKEPITIEIGKTIVEPEVTLASINDFGIVENIGEGRSDYSGSATGRIHNIKLAASRINGTLIPRGQTFSFNKTVGDISASTGYKSAYIIKGGETILGDGGGVCQVSTTLFRAAIESGLPIVERRQHAYRVKYYENDRKAGFDATVFSPTVDLKFTNDTHAHVLIQTGFVDSKNLLIFTFYGKKDDRQIEISDSTVWDVRPPPEPLYKDDPTLPKGRTKQIDFAAYGAKAKFHYRVVKDGKIAIDRDFYSAFRPWQAVYLVGTAE